MLKIIGNIEPFKITPKSSKQLLMALLQTEAEVIYIHKDDTCPDVHAIIKIEIDDRKISTFEDILGRSLEDVWAITGQ